MGFIADGPLDWPPDLVEKMRKDRDGIEANRQQAEAERAALLPISDLLRQIDAEHAQQPNDGWGEVTLADIAF